MASDVLLVQFQKSRICGLACNLRNGKSLVRNPLSVELDGGNGESSWLGAGKVLVEALRAKNHKGPRECVLVLHRQAYAVLQMKLPRGTEGEIASMVELELPQRIPYSTENICYGFDILGETTEDQILVEVYWTPSSALASILTELEQVGVTVLSIWADIPAYRDFLLEAGASNPLLFGRLSDSEFEIIRFGHTRECVFSRGRMLETPLDASPGNSDRLVSEFKQSFSSQCSEEGSSEGAQSCVVISESARADLPGIPFSDILPACAERRLSQIGESSREVDSRRFLPLLATAVSLRASQDKSGSAAVRSGRDMLPRGIQRSRRNRQARTLLAQAVFFGIMTIGLVASNIWYYAYQADQKYQTAQAEIVNLKPVVAEVEAMEERIQSIRAQIDYVLPPVEALGTINAVLADGGRRLAGLYLDKLIYDADGEIDMEGHATSDITPWEFAEVLQKSGCFDIKQPPRLTFRTYGNGRRAIRFQLALRSLPQLTAGEGKKESDE